MKFKKLEDNTLPAVELILTAEEATVLSSVLGKISGYSNDDGPRTFMSSLYNTLHNNGYRTPQYGGAVAWQGKRFKLSHDLRVDKV
jgi:hypothetical protein